MNERASKPCRRDRRRGQTIDQHDQRAAKRQHQDQAGRLPDRCKLRRRVSRGRCYLEVKLRLLCRLPCLDCFLLGKFLLACRACRRNAVYCAVGGMLQARCQDRRCKRKRRKREK